MIGRNLAKQFGKVVDGEAANRILIVMGKDLTGDTSTSLARKQLKKEMAQNIMKESGWDIAQKELAEEMAEAAISKKVKREALEKGAKKYATLGLKYGVIAGVGYAVFSWGSGFIPALGGILGAAGADAANDMVEWMGNNPLIATAGIGIGILFIGGLILTALAPSIAAKKAKDKVTGREEGSAENGE